MSITAMKQALAVLENKCDPAHEVITSLRQAIAEAEKQEQDEPFAWFHYEDFRMIYHNVWKELIEGHDDWIPLYTKPPQKQEQGEKFCDANCVWTDHHPDCKLAQQEQDEPVAWMDPDDIGADTAFKWFQTKQFKQPVYTTPQPAQKPWVGLTDKQKQWIKETEWTTDELIEWINTKLKEKNT